MLITGYRKEAEGFVGPDGALVPPDNTWFVGGSRVMEYRQGELLGTVVGVRFSDGDECAHHVDVRSTSDVIPPRWTTVPRAASTDRLAVRVEPSEAIVWEASLDEPGYLVFWPEGHAQPMRVMTFASRCCAGRFGFYVDPSPRWRMAEPDVYMLVEGLVPERRSVVRPMDLAGNLGDAWLIDPSAGTASMLTAQEAAAYGWLGEPPAPR